MNLKTNLLLFFLLIGFVPTQAQNICVDSNYINIYFQGCSHDVYQPVCACGVTYFNQCVAEQRYGVLFGTWASGVCGSFDFDFYPNLFILGQTGFIRFFLQFKSTSNNTATFMLTDLYGMTHDRRYINTFAQQEFFQYFPPANLLNGVYFLSVYTDTEIRVRKMVFIRGQ